MRRVEVFVDCAVGKVQFFLLDYPDKVALECVCRRHRGRIARFFAEGNWRQIPLLVMRDALVSQFLKRALKSVPSAGCGAPPDAFFAEHYPAIWEFMTLTSYDLDGLEMKRQTATMSVFSQDALWKCFLNDRETQRCLCVAATTFNGLWDALEEALTSDEVPWRQMLQGGGTSRQKRPGKGGGQSG